jgi:hypothetical protein
VTNNEHTWIHSGNVDLYERCALSVGAWREASSFETASPLAAFAWSSGTTFAPLELERSE